MSELSQAQREAYARAKTSHVELWALEFRHSVFPQPLRIVQHNRDIIFPIEAGAPVDGGTNQNFTGLAFRFREPEIGTDPAPTISIQIDGVSGALLPFIRGALQTEEPIECALRTYLYDVVDNVTVEHSSTLHLQMPKYSTGLITISATFGYANAANKSFPSENYTSETNPGL